MSNRYKGGVISATAPATTTSYGIWTTSQQMQAAGGSVWPTKPGAPTIGTATGGSGSASVTFTAPANTGYPTSLTYVVTSSPGSFTGTGASSPITVSGLTNGTAYTFTVTATNSTGTGPASAASNSVTPSSIPGAIGIAYAGGYFAGQISATANGVATHNLVVSDKTVGQADRSYYTSYPPPTNNPTSLVDGAGNTTNLVNNYGSGMPAAYFCENLNTGGYTDWYLPAGNELEILYWFLKPTNDSNTDGIWANVNAVSPEPYNTNHTSSPNVPSQTTSAAFQSGGAQAFNTTNYVSSTQYTSNPYQCYVLNFYTAAGIVESKTTTFKCRAIRKVAV
jgi:hypothetical protein